MMHQDLPLGSQVVFSRRAFLKCCGVFGAAALGAFFNTHLLAFAKTSSSHHSRGKASLVIANPYSWLLPITTDKSHFPKNAFQVVGLPGSLMKLLATTILLENHLINPNVKVDCRGITNRQLTTGQPMHCSHAHGLVSLTEALAVSCNAYFAQAIQTIRVPQFVSAYQMFFPNQPLKMAVTQENLPALLLGYHPNLSLSAFDILTWMQQLAVGQTSKQQALVSPHTLNTLQHGMRMAARQGTGKLADPSDHYQLAIKTGTSLQGYVYQSWAAGYFPFHNPQFIFCVRAQNGTSEARAIPMLKALLRQYQLHS